MIIDIKKYDFLEQDRIAPKIEEKVVLAWNPNNCKKTATNWSNFIELQNR